MQVKIKTETLPTRCEICHQTDCFDAARNFCSRCDGVPQTVAATAAPRSINKAIVTDIELGATIGMCLGLIIGLVGGWLALPNLAGIIIGLVTSLPVWIIHGAVVGLFVGESARITNAAEIGAVSKALATSPSAQVAEQSLLMTRLKALFATFRGVIFGFTFAAVPAFIINYLKDETFIWAAASPLLIWLITGMINGTLISTICYRRSDRRAKPYYTEAAQ